MSLFGPSRRAASGWLSVAFAAKRKWRYHHSHAPWTIDEANDACFIVRDSTRQALAYVYFEDEPGWRSAAKLLTRDEARRMAANFAKLPELLRRIEKPT